MLNEPVRGRLPEPGLFSLSGLEILRGYMRGLVPTTPLYRLLAPRVTQVSSGTTVIHQVLSPWFQMNEDFIDLTATSQYVIETTALSGAPPGSYLRTVNTSLRYLRPCTLQSEMVIGRGRILHTGGSFVTVEALFEDALGRAVAHATGSVTVTPMTSPPPPLATPLQFVEEPVYATPDPMERPLVESMAEGGLPPFGHFLGARLVGADANTVRVALPSSEWFCMLHREVAPGIIGLLGNLAIGASISRLIDADQRYVILQAATTAMAPVAADGRSLTATGAVRHRRDDVVVAEAEITDEDGTIVAIVQGPCLVRQRGDRASQRMSDRVLLTVLFTDLVGSTERAQQLGDTRWRELLGQHDAMCRRQVAVYKGQHVKSMGDGLLATFNSPTGAVRCAAAIRDGLRQLGLDVRAGIHTGECELVGHDVAGLAVHVASRVQAAAGPGEILISGAVRDLITPSEIAISDRGRHELRGLDGSWQLFAVGTPAT